MKEFFCHSLILAEKEKSSVEQGFTGCVNISFLECKVSKEAFVKFNVISKRTFMIICNEFPFLNNIELCKRSLKGWSTGDIQI